MPSSFSQKSIKIIITLGTGTFGSSTNNQITLQGYRTVVEIDKAGGMMMGQLKAKVYGVSQSDMNSACTLQWKPNWWNPNTVQVFAIDGGVETLIFAGNIINAWGDYQSMPDVFLHVHAQSAYYGQLRAVPPRSFEGTVAADVIMSQIAKDLGLSYKNAGVTAMVTDQYLEGTNIDQARMLSRAAGIDLYIDDQTLSIAPRSGPVREQAALVSASTGLVGYPTFDGIGVLFKSLFNPGITFGGMVKLETDLEQARGDWVVVSVAYFLESEKPGGAWFATVRGNRNGLAVVKQ